jgi:TetR/AcrR family transcriptional repressor of nem operon
MKVTRAQVRENRAHIVVTAARLFRERGYDGVGIAELMAAAGFTHGGFYKHFRSKADLMAEAAACGISQNMEDNGDLALAEFVDLYLSRRHRDAPGEGCTVAALCGDATRQSADVRATFAGGLERRVAAFQRLVEDEGLEPCDARAELIAMFAQLVGALVLSRACPDDTALADEILAVCRTRILKSLAPKHDASRKPKRTQRS